MGKTAHLRWALIPLSVALAVVALHKTRPVQADQAPPPTQKTLKLGEAQPGTLYAMTLAIKDPTKLQGADAVLAASIFHRREFTIGEAKAYMAARGVTVRPA